MYYYLNGELVLKESNMCVIDCGGVAYKLTISLVTSEFLSAKKGQKVKLYTHLAIREDGIEMFGFSSNEEKDAFNLLIGVSGVGPKAAINILSIMTPDKLALAICTEDTKAISKAQNIGSKTAARIVLELKDKITKDSLSSSVSSEGFISTTQYSHVSSGNLSEAMEALMSLGYDKSTVTKAVGGIDPSMDVAEIIRLALKKLSSR